jgi:exodeoxyribonuclease V beta subunit
LRGFLRGFVDLVVEHQGRYWVMDWKSNHLGYTAADYAPTALAPVVTAHGYALQALLYLLALHRHLRACLPGYVPEQHLGGAQLLFLRGLDAGHGQFTLPADARLIAALDALFA